MRTMINVISMITMINDGGCNNEAIPPFKGARGMLRQTSTIALLVPRSTPRNDGKGLRINH